MKNLKIFISVALLASVTGWANGGQYPYPFLHPYLYPNPYSYPNSDPYPNPDPYSNPNPDPYSNPYWAPHNNIHIYACPPQENDHNPPQSKDNKLDQEHSLNGQNSDTDIGTLIDIVEEWEEKGNKHPEQPPPSETEKNETAGAPKPLNKDAKDFRPRAKQNTPPPCTPPSERYFEQPPPPQAPSQNGGPGYQSQQAYFPNVGQGMPPQGNTAWLQQPPPPVQQASYPTGGQGIQTGYPPPQAYFPNVGQGMPPSENTGWLQQPLPQAPALEQGAPSGSALFTFQPDVRLQAIDDWNEEWVNWHNSTNPHGSPQHIAALFTEYLLLRYKAVYKKYHDAAENIEAIKKVLPLLNTAEEEAKKRHNYNEAIDEIALELYQQKYEEFKRLHNLILVSFFGLGGQLVPAENPETTRTLMLKLFEYGSSSEETTLLININNPLSPEAQINLAQLRQCESKETEDKRKEAQLCQKTNFNSEKFNELHLKDPLTQMWVYTYLTQEKFPTNIPKKEYLVGLFPSTWGNDKGRKTWETLSDNAEFICNLLRLNKSCRDCVYNQIGKAFIELCSEYALNIQITRSSENTGLRLDDPPNSTTPEQQSEMITNLCSAADFCMRFERTIMAKLIIKKLENIANAQKGEQRELLNKKIATLTAQHKNWQEYEERGYFPPRSFFYQFGEVKDKKDDAAS